MRVRSRLRLRVGAETERVRRAFYGSLKAFVARRVRRPADVDDILQTVFLRVHERLVDVRDERRLAPWLFQITRNAIIDYYRSAGARREVPLSTEAESEIEAPAEEVGRSPAEEMSRCLTHMVDALPPPYQEAVRLVELKGLTGREAGAKLNLSVSGIKSRVQRGRKKLKHLIQTCCHIELDRFGNILDHACLKGCGCQ